MTAIDKTHPSVSTAKDRLRAHAARIATDPQTNSVFAYAQELFQCLESGELSLADLGETALSVYGERVLARADRFRRQHDATPDLAARLDALAERGVDVRTDPENAPAGRAAARKRLTLGALVIGLGAGGAVLAMANLGVPMWASGLIAGGLALGITLTGAGAGQVFLVGDEL